MRLLCYAAVILLSIMIPAERTDIGRMKPMEVVMVTAEDGIMVRTDTDDWGYGENLEEALENLRKSSNGIVYYDTVEYVLVNEKAMGLTQNIVEAIGGDASIYEYTGTIELKDIGAFLAVHAGKEKDGCDEMLIEGENGKCMLKKCVKNGK